jgi:hypothetical protein
MSPGERSKGDFLKRLIPAARRLYGIELSEAKFESWIDEDVVSARKTDCYAYRRALEACRIENRAPPGRRLFVREIRIHLYLGGRDFQRSVIREDLREEFARSKRELFRSVRNMQSTIDAPQLAENRLSRLVNHLGEPATEIHPPAFRYQNHELASLISLALTGEICPRRLGTVEATPEQVIEALLERFGLLSFVSLLNPNFKKLFVGFLAGALGEATEIAEQAGELVFESARDAEFDIARTVLRFAPWITEQLPLMAAAVTPENQEILSGLVNPCHRIGQVIQNQPQFRLATFAILLTVIHRNPNFCHRENHC